MESNSKYENCISILMSALEQSITSQETKQTIADVLNTQNSPSKNQKRSPFYKRKRSASPNLVQLTDRFHHQVKVDNLDSGFGLDDSKPKKKANRANGFKSVSPTFRIRNGSTSLNATENYEISKRNLFFQKDIIIKNLRTKSMDYETTKTYIADLLKIETELENKLIIKNTSSINNEAKFLIVGLYNIIQIAEKYKMEIKRMCIGQNHFELEEFIQKTKYSLSAIKKIKTFELVKKETIKEVESVAYEVPIILFEQLVSLTETNRVACIDRYFEMVIESCNKVFKKTNTRITNYSTKVLQDYILLTIKYIQEYNLSTDSVAVDKISKGSVYKKAELFAKKSNLAESELIEMINCLLEFLECYIIVKKYCEECHSLNDIFLHSLTELGLGIIDIFGFKLKKINTRKNYFDPNLKIIFHLLFSFVDCLQKLFDNYSCNNRLWSLVSQ